MTGLQILPVRGIPEVRPGDDLAGLIVAAEKGSSVALEDGDVLVVAQKAVSTAEGRLVSLADVTPSLFAEEYARAYNKDARHVEVVLRESRRIVRMDHGVLIAETRHGFICANAGVDASNVEGEAVLCLLPIDSDASARALVDAISNFHNVTYSSEKPISATTNDCFMSRLYRLAALGTGVEGTLYCGR